jgi:hypothetical protein
MLVVDDNPWLEGDSPYAKMPTAHIHIQHFSPFNTASVAKTSQVASTLYTLHFAAVHHNAVLMQLLHPAVMHHLLIVQHCSTLLA